MIDFITGEKFITVGDFVYSPKNVNHDCNPVENTFCPCALKDRNIVYTHTMYVKSLFSVIRGLNCKFIIVSHNCDVNVDDSFDIPSNVEYWFTQNVNTINAKIQSIPIGLENEKWFKGLKKKQRMVDKLASPRYSRNLVYLNCNANTNPSKRYPVYWHLEGKSWATVKRGVNGQKFEEYLDDIYSHPFIVCPEGNGMDTHRTWEALYMGSIPIEKRNLNNRYYADLPICFVNSWCEITEDFLHREYKRILSTSWNLDKLKFEYWKIKIHEAK